MFITKNEKREWTQHVNYFNFMFFGHREILMMDNH
jgi:hypothetical protein